MEQKIQGEWNWVSTTWYYDRGILWKNIYTPEVTDTVMTIKVSRDVIEIIKNGKNFGQFNYQLTGDQRIMTIVYGSYRSSIKMEEGPVTFENNQMKIAGGYGGGFQILERKRQVVTTYCFSCHAEVPDITGEVHRYMDSSPGCWRVFGQILTREYSDGAYRQNHRITVDSYAVQHYGKTSPQSIQSVNLHLSSLYLIYVMGFDVKAADHGLTTLGKYKSELKWLTPPSKVGAVTVADILKAKDAMTHVNLVYEWGKSVWDAWRDHHKTVHEFVKRHFEEIERTTGF